jgi:hypothetical protein
MHTLGKRLLTQNDFEGGIEPIILRIVNEFITAKDFLSTLRNLPLSFLQRRQLCANYKALRTICNQRRGHKLSQWKQFVDHMETELMWPWAVMQHEERFDEHELIIALKEAVDLVDDKYIRSLLLVSSETINDLQTVIQNQEAENRNREANHD